ncbi:hypothetical protein [Flavobacterium flavigenum]|uniref:hypothetical protein n=1 Tax=Flavobacterium flavigenum TaxID=3003258 RepID=UPI0024831009|nr:hypothetical protein [Flavobacterium flavigenum]
MINILNIPYFAGGLSHLIPLYVLHHRYFRNNVKYNNQFLVGNNLQTLLKIQNVNCVSMDYFDNDELIKSKDYFKLTEYLVEKEKEAYNIVKPSLIIEDTSFTSPLIAEKNHIPRISIQRTGFFRTIDKSYRNNNHVHSIMKGNNFEKAVIFSDSKIKELPKYNNSDLYFFQQYLKPKVKIIPGIPTIECLPENIEKKESYFYCGPLIIMDRPSKNLSERLSVFLQSNKEKPIVFITTGTVDMTPVEKFIEYFVKRNYAVITTCNYEINNTYKQQVFYNKLLPLNYICGISNLVIHQCGSGMYHYPIINKVPSLTLGTQCYDREDIAIRLQELGVSGHIPHPADNADYWSVFVNMVHKFETKTLTNRDMIDKLHAEINTTMSNFEMNEVIEYALS